MNLFVIICIFCFFLFVLDIYFSIFFQIYLSSFNSSVLLLYAHISTLMTNFLSFYPATVKFDRDEKRIIAEIARQKDLESKGIVFVMIIATNKHFNVAIKQRSSFIDKTNK